MIPPMSPGLIIDRERPSTLCFVHLTGPETLYSFSSPVPDWASSLLVKICTSPTLNISGEREAQVKQY